MKRKSPIIAVTELADRASNEVSRQRAIARRAIAGAARGSDQLRIESVLRAADALAMLATRQIANSLANRGDCSESLLMWARMRLTVDASSVTEALGADVVYSVALHWLLDRSAGGRRAERLASRAMLSVAGLDSSCADVLAFLPAVPSLPVCRAQPAPCYAALARGINGRRPKEVSLAVERAAALYERGGVGSIRGVTPQWWVPLPLLLARESCRRREIPWPEIRVPSWAMWHSFAPLRRVRAVSPIERDLLALARQVHPLVEARRAREATTAAEVLGPRGSDKLSRMLGVAVATIATSRELRTVLRPRSPRRSARSRGKR